MAQRIPADKIEEIVGTPRHPTKHIARLHRASRTIILMHPHRCLEEMGGDLLRCRFTYAMDNVPSYVVGPWADIDEAPHYVTIDGVGWLRPGRKIEPESSDHRVPIQSEES